MKQLDLGCNPSSIKPRDGYECFGVDIHAHADERFKRADLVLEPIPYPDNSFDLVTAYDFLEHIPAVLYLPELDTKKLSKKDVSRPGWLMNNAGDRVLLTEKVKLKRRHPMIELFNEIYRVLKPGGEFYMQTPGYIPDYNNTAVWQDPTHVFVWTSDTANYFSGDYYGHHDNLGHTSDFQKIEQTFDNGHICLTLKATKPARTGGYTL